MEDFRGDEWNYRASLTTNPAWEPDMDACKLVSKDSAYSAKLVPLRLEDRKLICLGHEPIDLSKVTEFQAKACREVSLVCAPKDVVDKLLEACYGPAGFAGQDELVDSVSKPATFLKVQDGPQRTKRLNTGPMKVMAVTSGKGGVGKSSVTTNLAITLANRGYRVGVIDCDFGLSNMHVMLGTKTRYNLSDVINGKVSMLDAFEYLPNGMFLLAGAPGAAEFADLNYEALQRANAGFSNLYSAFDFLFLDTAAGIHDGVLSLLMAADETVLVMTPDPSSILDAYVTGQALMTKRPSAKVRCIVNQATNETDAKLIFAKFRTFVGMYSAGNAEFLGKIAVDNAAQEATRSRTPYVLSSPKSQATRDVDAIACRLANIPLPTSVHTGILERWFGKVKVA